MINPALDGVRLLPGKLVLPVIGLIQVFFPLYL